MTTAQEVEEHANRIAMLGMGQSVVLLRQYAEMIQKYEDAVAENVRLREAMNKYSEDEILLIERCAKVCEVMGFKHSECPEMSEYCAEAIRALAPRTERTCLWTEMDEDTNNWDTSCGTAWTIVDGSPTSNEIKYCHGCGLPIEVAEKPLYGADGGLIDRRIGGERRVSKGNKWLSECWNVLRSGTARRKA